MPGVVPGNETNDGAPGVMNYTTAILNITVHRYVIDPQREFRILDFFTESVNDSKKTSHYH
jgi:hypothetical protein